MVREVWAISERRGGTVHLPPWDRINGDAGGGRSSGYYTLRLLGRFELTSGGAAVSLPFQSQRLIALLALHDHDADRRWVAGMLWPEFTERRAASNLRSTLWRLGRSGIDVVVAERGCLALGSVSPDVRQVTADWQTVERGGVVEIDESLAEELLPGWNDDWVVLERDWYEQLRCHTFERLARNLLARGRPSAAVAASLAAMAVDPMREGALCCLVDALVEQGEVEQARDHVRRFCRQVHDAFGVLPSTSLLGRVGGDARWMTG